MGANLPFIVLGFAICLLIRLVIFYTPPRNFPKNIPTIPFYYALLPLIKDVDQIELYRQYLKEPLEKYGAVKIFFGGCWNILVQRPSFVAEVFKHEDVYAKSGNQKKIPRSVLASYTGDNIISAHGENWRLYQSVMKPGLQTEFDPAPVYRNADSLVDIILDEQRKASTVAPYLSIQRFTLDNLSEVLLGAAIGTLQNPLSPFSTLQSKIKPLIFSPIFLNFPFLDILPLPIRKHARHLAKAFTSQLCSTITTAHSSHKHGPLTNDVTNLGCRLLSAQQQGILSPVQFQHNTIISFVAGHENPQQLLLSALFVLSEHQEWQDRLREELFSIDDGETNETPDYATLKQLPLLTSTIYEILRLYPPISQLLNRRTTTNIYLSSPSSPDESPIPIPANTYVGYNGYATQHDTRYWGADADDFNPSRWGTTTEEIEKQFRARNHRCEFIAFHGGRRACLGQKFAMFEARIGIFRLLRRVRVVRDTTWKGGMMPAGPLYPKGLKVKFEEIERPRVMGEKRIDDCY